MTNVNSKSEIEVQNKLALFLIEILKSKGIVLKNMIINDEFSYKLNKSDFQSIEEESDTKAQ